MKTILISICIVFVIFSAFVDAGDETKKDSKKQLQIGIKKRVENCKKTSRKGDSLQMYDF
jgi:hypothetical protein